MKKSLPLLFLLAIAGCQRPQTSTSQEAYVQPLARFDLAHQTDSSTRGSVTFSSSPYGTLVNGSFQHVPAGTYYLSFADSCDKPQSVPQEFLGWMETGPQGDVQLSTLIPTARQELAQQHLQEARSSVILVDASRSDTVVACLNDAAKQEAVAH